MLDHLVRFPLPSGELELRRHCTMAENQVFRKSDNLSFLLRGLLRLHVRVILLERDKGDTW